MEIIIQMDDNIWQEQWKKLVVLQTKQYDALGGFVCCQLVKTLAAKLEGI
jgi:hypothetical protein